jgi:hypothetical protein
MRIVFSLITRKMPLAMPGIPASALAPTEAHPTGIARL